MLKKFFGEKQSNQAETPYCKVLLVGNPGVGKSNLISAMRGTDFSEMMPRGPYQHINAIDKGFGKFQFLEYDAHNSKIPNQAMGTTTVLFVIDSTQPIDDATKKLISQYRYDTKLNEPTTNMVLVLTKTDERPHQTVNKNTIEELIKDNDLYQKPYITSAKNNAGIEDICKAIVGLTQQSKQQPSKKYS